jgi:hypothetical protein
MLTLRGQRCRFCDGINRRDFLRLGPSDTLLAGPTRQARSDAYATGAVLVALRQAGGVGANDDAYRRGIEYLLKTQKDDGSWHIRTRSKPFQTNFESGFPHGKHQFRRASSARRSHRPTRPNGVFDASVGGTPPEQRLERRRPYVPLALVTDCTGRILPVVELCGAP